MELKKNINTICASGRGFFAFVVLPNIPFLILDKILGSHARGWINCDFVLLWGASVFLPMPAIVTLAGFLLLGDLFCHYSFVYYFTFRDAIASLGTLVSLDRTFMAKTSLEVILCLAITLVCFRLSLPAAPSNRLRSLLRVGVVGLLLLATDTALGNNSFFRMSDTRHPFNIATSSLANIACTSFRRVRNANSKPSSPPPASATEALFALIDQGPQLASNDQAHQTNIVHIEVESLGLPLDPDLREMILKPFRTSALSRGYAVEFGLVPFFGGTVSGEMRELCHSTLGLDVLSATSETLQNCLPAVLAKLGYRTEAVHNGASETFHRDHWYPKVGFQSVWFQQELSSSWHLPECEGVFYGTCDESVASWIGDRLVANHGGPMFIHWMTLHSHLPVTANTKNLTSADCSQSDLTRSHKDVCAWAGAIANVNNAIADLASRKDLPQTMFVIVGDHAPPFVSREVRPKFSQTEVPFIRLRPVAQSRATGGVALGISVARYSPHKPRRRHYRMRFSSSMNGVKACTPCESAREDEEVAALL